ncbi:signal peptidase I SipW [Paenibacillus woosongensis]|uniref:Signal peptidase I n=1 Tax=Paenibacillus woosongensis TaxID=307580 RepID=A0A7X2Z4G1_9BACL|nr:signal peptidase I [Paenibacillus woosongensis]MUG47316.1 signal peptidase I [Paenibacillus woosongensis]
MRLLWKLAAQTVYYLTAAVCLTVLGSVLLSRITGGEPNFYGYQLKTVLSGSMEPTIRTGSVIAISPHHAGTGIPFQAGDIITYRADEQRLITHRIIEVRSSEAGGQIMYRTQGDNNDAPDSALVVPSNIVGVYTGFTIPYAGYLLRFAGSKAGSLLLLVVPGLILLLYGACSIWKALSQLEQGSGVQADSGADAPK